MNPGLRVRELSAPGRGAVSVLAFEGAAAAAWLERSSGTALPRPGALSLVHIREQELVLDEALLVPLGPERFELHVHGSPPLVRRLLVLSDAPTEPAPARSVEERAAALLARAQGEAASRMLLDQAEGALRRELAELASAPAAQRRGALEALAERARVARLLVEPARVVIAGPANAGKSTLFNVLLGEGRALVHADPGTTRDALRERAFLGAYPVWLHDTAGERALGEGAEVEALGQELARRLVASADLVLWLDAGGETGAPRHANARVWSGPRALEEPQRTRARAAALFREHFLLPEAPWQAGAGVPFDLELAECLARLEPGATRAAWLASLEPLLGPDCGPGPDHVP